MESELFDKENLNPEGEYDSGNIIDKGLGGTTPPTSETDQNFEDRGLGSSTPPDEN